MFFLEDYEKKTREYEEQKRKMEQLRRQREEQAQIIRQYQLLMDHSMEIYMEETRDLVYDPEGTITSREIYGLYSLWCREKGITAESSRKFLMFLKERSSQYRIRPINGLSTEEGKRVRGFRGIRADLSILTKEPESAV